MKSLTNKLSNLSRSQIDGTSTYCRGPPLTREDTATLSDSKACADQMAHSEDHDKVGVPSPHVLRIAGVTFLSVTSAVSTAVFDRNLHVNVP